MRRSHRSMHLLLWLLLIPVIAGTAYLALTFKDTPAQSDSLPPALIEEAS